MHKRPARIGPAIAVLALFVSLASPARSEDAESSWLTRPSLLDDPGGLKEQLRNAGVTTEVWVTQFYQSQFEGDATKAWFYGGKTDAFLNLDFEKLGLWSGFRVNAQFEHEFGANLNRKDFALAPVNTALAYLDRDGYHETLSLTVTQNFGDHVSASAGKFNMMTLASRTPLVGGGGIETFMNRALALPSTGVAYTAARGAPVDRVIVSPPYLLAATLTLKTDPIVEKAPATLTLLVADPRSALDPRVIEYPLEKGWAVGASATLPVQIAGLRGFHTLRAAYSNARGIDLEAVADQPPPPSPAVVRLKKGYWFASYAIQQYLVQSETDPAVGWGFFSLVTTSDGNPNPVKWSGFAGLAGNTMLEGRENDRWGVGFFQYGFSEPLLEALAAFRIFRKDERGVEAFYNLAITPWLRLSADLQVIDPWNPARAQAAYAALRLQTKF
jgi:porin